MPVENIGTIYQTKIPGLADAADIQAAFYAYHYGAYTSVATTAGIITPSIAQIFKDLETDIATLEARPSSGGAATSAEPVVANFPSATSIPNGYIWVDVDAATTSSVIGATAIYNNNAPTSNLTAGVIWVDKDASTSTTGNPFIPQTLIDAKGDLLVGSTSDTVIVLTVGSDGSYLKADSSTTSGLAWSSAGDLTAISSGTGITVTNGAGPIPSIAIDTATVVDLSTAQTLTNKTLTSPVLGGTTTTASGNLAVQPATYILEVKGGGATEGAVQLNCAANSHGQVIKSQPHAQGATNTLLLPGGSTIGNSNATLVSDTGTQTLTNKTLTNPIFVAPEERLTITAASATGTINIDTATSGTLYYTNSASSNHVINVRHSSSTSLNNTLTTGDSITVVWLNTNGATAYYPTVLLVDSATSGVSTKWQGGTAPSSGNASSVDAYVYNIMKTASATFTVLASQTKFA
jgi:hypothetical protein